jgi:hypothetical protein
MERPLPGAAERRVPHDGASIWSASYGPASATPVILLPGGNCVL